MKLEVFINEADDSNFDVDVFNLDEDRNEELTKNGFTNLSQAEYYVTTLIQNKNYIVYFKGITS